MDINYNVIMLFQRLTEGWIPPKKLTKEAYKFVRLNQDRFKPEIVGFVGAGCSYGGGWFAGYSQSKSNSNYALQSHNSLLRQIKKLGGVRFVSGSYQETTHIIPPKSIIYCDPPYSGTSQAYKMGTTKFDSELFYQWCRDMKDLGHTLFISEYSAPNDFKLVYEKEVTIKSNTVGLTKKNRIERLYKC